MASLASLVVSLVANTGSFNTNMDRTAKQHAKRMREMERVAADVGKKLAFAFAGAATSLGAVVVKTANTADQMAKLSQRLGTSTESLSELSHVADLSGVQFNQLTIGLQRMERRIAEVASLGKGEAKQALEQLGLSAEKLARLPVDQQFEAVAEQLSKVQSESERVRLAFKLFDSEGVALVQTMGEGAAGIQRMREEARQLGKVISTETAASAVAFNDNLTRLRAQLEGVGIQIASEVLPVLSKWLERLIQSGSVMETARSIGEKLVSMFRAMGAALEFLAEHATSTVAALGGFATLKFIPGFFAKAHPLIALTSVAVGGLVAAFIQLRNEAQQTQRVLADLEGSINDTTTAWINSASAAELISRQAEIRREWIAADQQLLKVEERLAKLLADTPDDLEQYHGEIKILREEQERLQKTQADAVKRLVEVNGRLEELKKGTKDAANETGIFDDTLSDVVVTAKALTGSLIPLVAVQDRFKDKIEDINDLWEESEQLWRDVTREQERYEQSLQGIVDAARPIDAAIRRTQEQMDILNRAMREGDIDAQTYAAAVRYLAAEMQGMVDAANNAEKGVDLFAEAVKEGIRILERTLSDLFNGLVDGSLDAFDVIESGFKALIASMAQQASRRIVVRVEQAFSEGGGGFGDLFNAEFGGELIASIGQIIGLSSADSLFGQLGSSLGSILGKTAGVKLLTVFGSFGGPIGSAIGAILGSVLGDLVGGLFERDLAFSLGGANQRTRGDNQSIRTPLGEILGLSGQGGFGSLNDPSTFGGQLAKALTEFDTQIANILKTVGVSDETFDNITTALNNWVASFGEGADAVDVVASRFGVILSQFDADIQNFVRGAADFEQQIERFGVALSVEKLIGDNPEFFSGRTAAEVLSVVSAFQSGAETMSEAFEEFLQVANAVIAVTASLREFADSDLEAEFRALINPESLEQSLANVNAALLDSIANFDGSIDALNTIGQLALVAREGELKLLQQIDDIQKGLNSNLDKLRNDILGVGDQPQTITQTFLDAEQLIRQLGGATSSQEIASIGQEFDALIRGLDEDQLAKARPDLLKLIDLFQQSSNLRLDFLRQNTLDNAASVRDAVDVFLTGIGDPLNIIAESLNGDSIPEVMDEGLENINQSVQQIGPQVAAALGQVFGDGINVTVVVQDSGLVTQ